MKWREVCEGYCMCIVSILIATGRKCSLSYTHTHIHTHTHAHTHTCTHAHAHTHTHTHTHAHTNTQHTLKAVSLMTLFTRFIVQ